MKDKELLQKAIDEGDFSLAQQLLSKLNTGEEKTKTKKGRLSNNEIQTIQKLSLEGKSISEIASILNRNKSSIEKYILNRNKSSIEKYFNKPKPSKENQEQYNQIIQPSKQKLMAGRVQFAGNTFQDDGMAASSDKEIDKKLSENSPRAARRDKPKKVLSECSHCEKKEEIPPHLANSDPDSRKIYHICSNCIREAKGKLT